MKIVHMHSLILKLNEYCEVVSTTSLSWSSKQPVKVRVESAVHVCDGSHGIVEHVTMTLVRQGEAANFQNVVNVPRKPADHEQSYQHEHYECYPLPVRPLLKNEVYAK